MPPFFRLKKKEGLRRERDRERERMGRERKKENER